jgi:hypothetical protein
VVKVEIERSMTLVLRRVMMKWMWVLVVLGRMSPLHY